MSTLAVATIKSNTSGPPVFENTSGTEIGRLCRAFVNFNGTGTVAIRAQYNVSSITDNGVGNFTVNFTTALSDVNYTACTQATNGTGVGVDDQRCFTSTPSGSYATGTFLVGIVNSAANAFMDSSVINVAIFR